jgi:hypothetical protein
VWSETKRKISVRFLYTYGSHRTRPWLSRDGEKWERLAERDHTVNRDLGEGTGQTHHRTKATVGRRAGDDRLETA